MTHLHKRIHLYKGDNVEVSCTHECTVLLVDDVNYGRYRKGLKFNHVGGGGFFKELPVTLITPRDGQWNVVLFLSDIHRSSGHNESITVTPAGTPTPT